MQAFYIEHTIAKYNISVNLLASMETVATIIRDKVILALLVFVTTDLSFNITIDNTNETMREELTQSLGNYHILL